MEQRQMERTVASAIAWLDRAQAGQVLRMLTRGDIEAANILLDTLIPDLTDQCNLWDLQWRHAILEELAYRISPEDPEADQDELDTQEVPNYALFATDLR